jgi:hypothetical protein
MRRAPSFRRPYSGPFLALPGNELPDYYRRSLRDKKGNRPNAPYLRSYSPIGLIRLIPPIGPIPILLLIASFFNVSLDKSRACEL